ncbi:Fur family transcriptional regulator [Vaginisenegalia massiliensis]|uniref:Fur family transcriptional regulator n=1 Tax=Vaginisenegalia massiliensis TaxID=2058294 RepID=UPI001F14B247|nr:Fur family transcriptional regulator [Vaginisenegalia massiliensis]
MSYHHDHALHNINTDEDTPNLYEGLVDTSEMMVEHIISDLKKKNVRMTPQRKAILTFMVDSHHHPTVEEIHKEMLKLYPNMSLATVYNNLNFFVEEGIIHEMKFSGITSRYDFMGHKHFHIICKECGKISDFVYSDLSFIKEPAQRQTGYEVLQTRLELYGICPECQAKRRRQKEVDEFKLDQ